MDAKNIYQNGKMYKFINDIDDEIYVGSTVNKLCIRFADHKASPRKQVDRRVYKHINTNGGWEHVKIILNENYPCASKED